MPEHFESMLTLGSELDDVRRRIEVWLVQEAQFQPSGVMNLDACKTEAIKDDLETLIRYIAQKIGTVFEGIVVVRPRDLKGAWILSEKEQLVVPLRLSAATGPHYIYDGQGTPVTALTPGSVHYLTPLYTTFISAGIEFMCLRIFGPRHEVRAPRFADKEEDVSDNDSGDQP